MNLFENGADQKIEDIADTLTKFSIDFMAFIVKVINYMKSIGLGEYITLPEIKGAEDYLK